MAVVHFEPAAARCTRGPIVGQLPLRTRKGRACLAELALERDRVRRLPFQRKRAAR